MVYHGSCHCRKVEFVASFEFSRTPPPVITKCNCTMCHKSGTLQLAPLPGSFKLLAPADPDGLSKLSDYTFYHKRIHHYFCTTCGVKPFLKGSYVMDGSTVNFVMVNPLALDMDTNTNTVNNGEYGIFDLRKIKTKYQDGREENWMEPLKDEPYEGGVW